MLVAVEKVESPDLWDLQVLLDHVDLPGLLERREKAAQ